MENNTRERSISLKLLKEIDKACKLKGVNQAGLAKLIGTSKPYVSQLFSGKKKLNIGIMAKIEEALEFTFDIQSIGGDPYSQIAHQDEIIGRLTRRVEVLEQSSVARDSWLREAKQMAGFNQNISFDRVWEVALEALFREAEFRKG